MGLLTYLLVKYWLSDVSVTGNMAILDNMPAELCAAVLNCEYIGIIYCIYSRISRPAYKPTPIPAAENVAKMSDSRISR